MITHRIKIVEIAILLLALFALPRTSNAESPNDILIIANKGLNINYISPDELKQLFLGKKTNAKSGEKIICINSQAGTAVREIFRTKVLEMSKSEEMSYWERAKIRKQLSPPPEFVGVAKAVFKLPNAISYAYRKDVPTSVVKVLLVIPQ